MSCVASLLRNVHRTPLEVLLPVLQMTFKHPYDRSWFSFVLLVREHFDVLHPSMPRFQ